MPIEIGLVFFPPLPSSTVKLKLSSVGFVTFGATKLAFGVFAPCNWTVGAGKRLGKGVW